MMAGMKSSLYQFLLRYFPFIVVFSTALYNPTDPDLGWHLKYGEYFFKTGTILKTNLFSSDMVDYTWVNHSWLMDILTYVIYRIGGFAGLSITGALIITGMVYFLSKTNRYSLWEKGVLFPVILVFLNPLLQISFRPQLVSLFFISLELFLFNKASKDSIKYGSLFIPLFLLWSNLHGEFILGLGLLFIWAFINSIDNIRNNKTRRIPFVLICTLCTLLATLINPFGIGIITETFRHFGNPLQRYIIEWNPLDIFSIYWWSLVGWVTITVFSTSMIIRKKNYRPFWFTFTSSTILILLSFWMRRYIWPMILVSLPLITEFVRAIKPKNQILAATIPITILISIYGYTITVKNPEISFLTMDWERYCQYISCSQNSVKFLLTIPDRSRLLTFYNWGGWLIWNYPEIKPSIDGRMSLWMDKRGYSAFAKYYTYEQNALDIDQSEYNLVYMSPTKPLYRRLKQLTQDGRWKVLFEDSNAAIFQRVLPQPSDILSN